MSATPTLAPSRRPFNPGERGLSFLYHGAGTRCPGCHRQNWFVGRVSAECGFCATAIPLAPVQPEVAAA